jgi:hypothetical protein
MMDAIHHERILKARGQQPEQRFAEAMELTDFAFEVMENAVRSENPGCDDATVNAILRKRLARLRRREDHLLFQPLRKLS